MLCGHPPFYDSQNVMSIYEKVLAGVVHYPADMDPHARDLIAGLLRVDRSQRLGNLRGGPEDIQRHPFFAGVDWAGLLDRQMLAPILPRVRAPEDTANFARYPPLDPSTVPGLLPSHAPSHLSDPFAHLFANF